MPYFEVWRLLYPHPFTYQGKSDTQDRTYGMLFPVKFHPDWCILSPMMGLKSSIWPDVNHLGLAYAPPFTARGEIWHGEWTYGMLSHHT